MFFRKAEVSSRFRRRRPGRLVWRRRENLPVGAGRGRRAGEPGRCLGAALPCRHWGRARGERRPPALRPAGPRREFPGLPLCFLRRPRGAGGAAGARRAASRLRAAPPQEQGWWGGRSPAGEAGVGGSRRDGGHAGIQRDLPGGEGVHGEWRRGRLMAGRRCGIAGAWEERRDQLWDRPWSRGAGLDAGSVEILKATGFDERGLMKPFW